MQQMTFQIIEVDSGGSPGIVCSLQSTLDEGALNQFESFFPGGTDGEVIDFAVPATSIAAFFMICEGVAGMSVVLQNDDDPPTSIALAPGKPFFWSDQMNTSNPLTYNTTRMLIYAYDGDVNFKIRFLQLTP